MPTPRWFVTTNTVNDKIYAIGWTFDSHVGLTTVEELHPYGVAIATRKIDEASDGETQTQSECDSIESTQMPDIVYGWSNVHLTDSPRLKEKIGVAATVGIQLTVSSHKSFDATGEVIAIYVPASYRDNTPHGVWVSIDGRGEQWASICEEKKLIFIKPQKRIHKLLPHEWRARFSLEARRYALLNYNIEPHRIYILKSDRLCARTRCYKE